jgi:hypothetical protein
MKRTRDLVLLWLLVAAVGAGALAWAFPRAFPFLPPRWSVTREEAARIALERLRDLGEPVKDAYVVTTLPVNSSFERRLQEAAARVGRDRVRASSLPAQIAPWQVLVYPPGAVNADWRYTAYVSMAGEVLSLRLRLDPQEYHGEIAPAAARARADQFLRAQGIDLSRFEAPEVLTQQSASHTDRSVRYRDRHPVLSEPDGIEVSFAGDRLAGFEPWIDPSPHAGALLRVVQGTQLSGFIGLLGTFGLVVLLSFPFLKRYHEGEIGVRRGVEIFLLLAAVGILYTLCSARSVSQNVSFGFASRQQATWLVVLFSTAFGMLPAAILGFFAWSVGESICRQRLGRKLAAFDALFQGDWGNDTVARSAFIGSMAGFAGAGAIALLLLPLQKAGAWPMVSTLLPGATRVPALDVVNQTLSLLPILLAVTICVLPLLVRRLGRWGGGLVTTLLAALVLTPPALPLPWSLGLVVAFAFALLPVALFLVRDLLAALSAAMVAQVLLTAYPLLTAADPSLQANGWAALGVVLLPMLLSVRCLGSRREFVYRYEDVPPHVRRIADRERQRVELETARGIQSSILPELPPRLAGVDLAHCYLPASEVGGDFYDVLALEDGRLAVAVGDVAGHGVSSGLVMSMAKSALAVQVTFDPGIEAVFRTLNRMVHQTARKRLLATLCYALLDPERRELLYASAGHLFPYRITKEGQVLALGADPNGYPLGVRRVAEIEVRLARLEAGDMLFLFSDGVVEARPEGSDEQFGFERLEESLARHSRQGPEELRDAVLADVARFTRHAPREDDQTILILRLP